MSEIKKYKKYLNFKANPRYLTRDFIVPLYTGTEPDILDDSDTQRESSVYKEFPNDMPIISPKRIQNQPYEQLELADGGRVGFELGGRTYKINKPLTTEQQNRIKKNYPNADFSKFKYGFSEKDTNNYKNVYSFVKRGKTQIENRLEKLKELVLESNLKPFESLNERQVAIKAGYVSAANLKNRSEVKNILNQLIPLEEKFSNYLNNVINNLDNIPYEDIVKAGGMNKYVAKPFGVDKIALNRKINNAYSKPEFKEARDIIKLLSNPQVFDTYGKIEMLAGEVLDNLDATKSARRLKGGSIGNEIINTAERSMKAGNKNINFLTKPGTVDASDIVFEWNGKLYGKDVDEYKGRKVNNLTTDLYKLPEFNEYLDVKTKINELRKKQVIDPQTKKPTTYDQLLRKTYAKGFGKNTSYERSGVELDHLNIKDEPFSNLRPLPAHINQTAGLIKKSMSIIEDKDKALKAVGYFMPKDALENSILKFSDRVLNKNIPVSKTYDVGLRSITGGSKEYLSPESKITTEGLREGKTGTESLLKGQTQVMTSSGLRNVSEKETRIPKEFSEQKTQKISIFKNILEDLPEDQKTQFVASYGCPTIGRALGGRVKFSNGSNCYIKGLEKIEQGDINVKDISNLKNIAKGIENLPNKTISKINVMDNILKSTKSIGKGAVKVGDVVLSVGAGPWGFVAGVLNEFDNMREEIEAGNYKEAYNKSILGFLTPEAVSPKSLNEQLLEFVQKNPEKYNVKEIEKLINRAEIDKKIQGIEKEIVDIEENPQTIYTGFPQESQPTEDQLLNPLYEKYYQLQDEVSNPKYGKMFRYSPEIDIALKDYIKFNLGENYKKNVEFVPGGRENVINEKIEEIKNRYVQEMFPGQAIAQQAEKKDLEIKNRVVPQMTDEERTIIESSAEGAADGGRIGLSGGGGPKMGRRGFLGLLTGIAAAPELIKSIKGTKKAAQIAKVLPKVSGMPEWFNPLVTKIMKEGVDISPKAERVEDIVKVKKLEFTMPEEGTTKFRKSGSKYEKKNIETITMTEYPNGDIEIEADVFGSSFDAPFSLHYKPPKTDIHIETGEPVKYPGDFYVIEQRPKPDYGDPGSFEIDYEVMSVDDTISDLERIEKMATGKIIPLQRVKQRTGARKFVEENPSEDIVNRYGDSEIEYDRMKDEGLLDE